jgi:putative ABC transport system permease protein
MAVRVSALNRKLFRDLWEMKGQALAIALVIGAGVAMFVMYLSNFDSLERTQLTYYERQRFADVFASLTRAPRRLADRIQQIPGVESAEARVVADVILDIPGMAQPAQGRLISVPGDARPRLNDVFLRLGRWIDPARPDEVLVSEAFALAHELQPGDRVAAIINGRQRRLQIVGIALSPEYVYSIPPGELIPDNRRFSIFWMDARALGAAFDMEGGFNNVTLTLAPGASIDEVIARLDRLLLPYGGAGAIPRALQISHWTLQNELAQLQSFGFLVPAIFLGVAAFLLNVALTRALAIQRPQIAALKALGYANREVGWHYVKWALLIAVAGTLIGIVAGGWLGAGMIAIYNDFFRFPELYYQLSARVAMGAAVFSLVAASLGAVTAVSRAVRIPPAEAMRPEPPVRYGASIVEARWLRNRLPHATRMVLRNVQRQPVRTLASVVGLAFAVAVLVVGMFFLDAMDVLLDMQFAVIQRQDVTVTFNRAVSSSALHAVESMPGVIRAEPLRVVPARIRFGHRSRQIVITGLTASPDLNRVVDRSGRVVALPRDGLVLSQMLADILGVGVGDAVTLEVLEGERPVRQAPVAGLVDEFMGLSAYMEIGTLHRLLREGGALSGAYLEVDAAFENTLFDALKATPAVAGVTSTRAALESFRQTMDQSMGIMTTINLVFAGIIAFGVVYNAARISLSERSRELASLRVLGFTVTEISSILLGELAVVTLLSLPVGALVGYGLALLIVSGFQSEVYRFPLVVTPQAVATAWLAVIVACVASGLVVQRRLRHLDLVGVLKTRE